MTVILLTMLPIVLAEEYQFDYRGPWPALDQAEWDMDNKKAGDYETVWTDMYTVIQSGQQLSLVKTAVE